MKIYSVVVCSYNKLDYLKVVVPKIKSERPENEIILSDDCSNDGTVDWAHKSGLFSRIYSKKVREPYCLCTARNIGITLSSHENIVFLDSDCLPNDGYFSGHDFVFEIEKDCLSVGFTDHYSKDGQTIISEDPRKPSSGDDVCPIAWNNSFGGNVAFTKSVFNKVGVFDESFNGHWGFEDLDIAYRAITAGFKIFAHRKASVKHLAHVINSEYQSGVLKGENYKLLLSKHGNILNIP